MCVMNIDDCCVSNRLGCMFFFTESSVFEHIYRRDTIRERESEREIERKSGRKRTFDLRRCWKVTRELNITPILIVDPHTSYYNS